jgi:hypothetical protein
MKSRLCWIACACLPLAACDKPSNERASEETRRPPAPRPPRIQPANPENKRSAMEAAEQIAEPEERDKAISEIAWNAIGLDPELAREAFDKLTPDSEERIQLVRHFAMSMADDNIEEALKWARGLESELEKSAACGQIALVIADTDPSKAAHLISESGIEGRHLDVAVVQVVQRWADQSPDEAAGWVALFPPGEVREAGIRTVVALWVETDRKAAFTWMAGLTDESIRSEIALALAIELVDQEPEDREEWLASADATTRSSIEAMKAKALEETGLSQ